MRILIEIDCDTVNEITSHLKHLREQIKKEAAKKKLDIFSDEFEIGTELEDANCYGEHTLTVVPVPL